MFRKIFLRYLYRRSSALIGGFIGLGLFDMRCKGS